VHRHGIPTEFIDHASRGQILERIGLTPEHIATELASRLS
jgi:1-deoxy-D-xylulose-5-phosphate synthase